MTGYFPLRAILMGSCAILFPLAAMTQAVDPVVLDTIVIDSKRKVQTETATAVTGIDQEEIDDRQAGTVAELIDSVPGVTLINGSTPSGGGINIRGFGSGNTYGTNQKVLIQIDGATQGSEELYRLGTQLFTDPELYKSVSVLRGTVGSFEYGSGVVGGIVRLDTKDASDFTGGQLGYRLRQGLSFGSNGDSIASSSTLAWQPTEDFEMLANYTWRRQDEQKDGGGRDTGAEGFKLPSYLVKAKYTFGDNRDQWVSASFNRTEIAERDVPYDAFGTTGGAFGNVDRDIRSSTATLAYGWDPAGNDLIDLKVQLSYADQKIDQTWIPGSGMTAAAAIGNADHRYETTQLTIRNTARYNMGSIDNELRAGVEFIRKKRLDANSAPGGTDDRIAFFVLNEMDFNNGLTLTPALRYETQDIDGTRYGYGAYSNDAFMGGVSARYEWASGVSVFASAAYTESLPILDDLTNTGQNWNGLNVNYMTTPERARTYEIGAAYRGGDLMAEGDALSVKANIYHTNVWDITSESGVRTLDQKGLELEAAYSLANGIYTDFNANIVDYDARNMAGLSIRNYTGTPADQLRLTVGKRWDRELDLSWEMVANARYDKATKPVPGSTVHNLRATYRPASGLLEGTELRFAVENVFDKDYTPRLATRAAPGRNVKFALAKTF